MTSEARKYDHRAIEAKWQKAWQETDAYRADDGAEGEKRMIMDMYPYPSAAGLHVGHVESYTATDILSRYLRMQRDEAGKPKYNVAHPQGWDAFGLPAENYAVKTGVHPSITTHEAIANFKRQMNALGLSYDWSREVATCDPDYYRWTQWFFLFLYEHGLAYKKKAKANWCESCQTVLANEQAEGGTCDRCGNPVIQKDLEQWFFKITDFVDDQESEGRTVKGLLSGLDDIDWPESTKAAQRNWIGRSEGAIVKFQISNSQFPNDGQNSEERYPIEVFTTRPDTLFGATYFVLAPEHPLVAKIVTPEQQAAVEEYVNATRTKTELGRTDLNKEKSGVFTGAYAVNPVNDERIPVWIADYVLMEYGTGAIMAVPAHDERDFEFAKKYDLPVAEVVTRPAAENFFGSRPSGDHGRLAAEYGLGRDDKEIFTGDGMAVNSGFLDGLPTPEAKAKMIAWLQEKGLGERKINYRLRDWPVSRQRYWGAPIPIIYCAACGAVPVPEKDLPVLLPEDVDFKPTGESPLTYSQSFQAVVCPTCGAQARREADTMDTFVCSSWYYFRYADPKNEKAFADKEKMAAWLPVDVYVGGAEHTVLHLLYSRFFTKALQKFGFIDFNEPFLKLRHQGIILAEDGNKMSKSKGNVINPDDVVAAYGADTLRLYEMFLGPLEDMKPWSTQGIVGIRRFLERVWRLGEMIHSPLGGRAAEREGGSGSTLPVSEYRATPPQEGISRLLHKTVKKVTEDIEAFKFNTAVSAMMILINAWEKAGAVAADEFALFLRALSPFAPHLCEELWERLGNKESVSQTQWPAYDPAMIVDETVTLAVQVNGKLRDTDTLPAGADETAARDAALSSEKVRTWTAGKEIVKVIYVPGRMVSVVVN